MYPKTQYQITNLTTTKCAYSDLILSGLEDPYQRLIKEKLKVVPGTQNSNLFAMVRIKNSGKEAINYRQIANKTLFDDVYTQLKIIELFKDRFRGIEFSKAKNPKFIGHDGSTYKTVWHHSPNHILSISLILEKTHREYKKVLHYKGKKGGNAMFSILE